MIYALAQLQVTDPDTLAAYRAKAAEALARHGGRVEQASATLTLLEGARALPDTAALLSFPDRAAALAWAEDPSLQAVHALRRGAGVSDILLLG